MGQGNGLEGGPAKDGDVGGPLYLAVEGFRDVGVVVAGGDEGGDGGQALQLLAEEVAGVQGEAIVLVEVAADGDGVDLSLQGEVDEAAEGVAELLAAGGGDAGGHAAAAEGAIQVEVRGVEYGRQRDGYLLKGMAVSPILTVGSGMSITARIDCVRHLVNDGSDSIRLSGSAHPPPAEKLCPHELWVSGV